MIDQHEEDLYLSQPPLPEIVLDISDTDLVDDDLYERLLDAFIAKAKLMGYDVVERKDLVLSDWTLKSTLDYI